MGKLIGALTWLFAVFFFLFSVSVQQINWNCNINKHCRRRGRSRWRWEEGATADMAATFGFVLFCYCLAWSVTCRYFRWIFQVNDAKQTINQSISQSVYNNNNNNNNKNTKFTEKQKTSTDSQTHTLVLGTWGTHTAYSQSYSLPDALS